MAETTPASPTPGGNSGNQPNSGSVALPTFAEQLDGSLKSDPAVSQYLSGYKDKKLSDFVRDSYEMGKANQSLKGEVEKRVKVPGENATKEEINAWNKALNIPENGDGYEIKRPEKMPEGMLYNETLEAGFRQTAHKLGLTQAQTKGLYEFYNNHEMNNYDEVSKFIKENRDKAENALKDIWKGDSFKENRTKTVRTFYDLIGKMNIPKQLGTREDIVKEFNESGFGDNPFMNWFFYQLFDKVNIDSFGQNSPPSNQRNNSGTLDFSKSMPPRT